MSQILPETSELTPVLVQLLKGPVHRDGHEKYLAPAAGSAVRGGRLRHRAGPGGGRSTRRRAMPTPESARFPRRPVTAVPTLPRLVARRPLSFRVSLLLALLRKKLAEFDAGGGHDATTAVWCSPRNKLIELVRIFLPDSSNEARLITTIEATSARSSNSASSGADARGRPCHGARQFEVRRILKAYVDGQWLAEFDARLAAYRLDCPVPTTAAGGAHE